MEKNINEYILREKRNEWRRKSWSIPDLRGGKNGWFNLVKNLIKLVDDNQANDLDAVPKIQGINQAWTWRVFLPFLKGIGLVNNNSGYLYLSEDGLSFLNNCIPMQLANIIHKRVRLFGEVLELIAKSPITVEEADELICKMYKLNWNNLSNIRKRMDWLEILGLIQIIGNRKWEVTQEGKNVLNDWSLIPPEALETEETDQVILEISDPPEDIAVLLSNLFNNEELHNKRNTYNIWAPSPNRIENLRVIVQSASEKITRVELFRFICDEFNLKESSAESMLPFLKAAGLIEEVGRSIYKSTPAAQAWIRTGNDLDFVRILHCHMQFVGEMIKYAENDVIRNDLYSRAVLYGLNAEKARWIAGFLIEAGLLEEPQYLHLKATPLGMRLVASLPLLDKNISKENELKKKKEGFDANDKFIMLAERLEYSSKDPNAEGKASGVAFEENIAEMFAYMGFDTKRIGGSGDTDVVVHWNDDEGKVFTAIIDGKSKTGGQVSHSDISDIALDSHKDKNNADYVAIVGPKFAGDTIVNHARKKNFALITTEQLIEIAKTSRKLGLSLKEISLIFQVPNGFSQLADLISMRERELEIISVVISKFSKEQGQIGALSPRDMFLLLRDTNVSPSLEELINIFKILSNDVIGILNVVVENRMPENTMYLLIEPRSTVFRLRSFAIAIEQSIANI